ncbi:MAG TPA: hypothetical protein PKY13_13175 [Microthrixaceae bacterium]|nr:hypothetical protein [Microthrixaceae bacterium]
MSNTTTRSQNLPTVDRVRLGVVRTIAVGLLASGALVVFAGAASAKPIVPDLDIDDITVATLPPVTIPPKTIPPFTIPPVVLDPGSPTTVPPTVPPVVVNPTTTVKPPVTIPPVIVNPTVPPTTVAPEPTPDPTDPTTVPDPTVPADVEGATETAAGPESLAVTGNDSNLPIIGASLLGAGLVIVGGMAYDRRRKAQG